MLRINKVAKRKLIDLLRLTLMVLVGGYLYQYWTSHSQVISPGNYKLINHLVLILPWLLILTVVNWSLEAGKWRILSRSVGSLSFQDSFRGVVSGLTLSFLIPAGFGDCLGRLGHLSSTKKIEATALIYLGGIIQFLVTTLFGLYGVIYLLQLGVGIDQVQIKWPVIEVLMAILTLMILVFLIRSLLPRSLVRGLNRIGQAIRLISFSNLLLFIFFSILRYCVFAFQLWLLFDLMELGLDLNVLIAGITWIYLTKTVLPLFSLVGDLGIRELSAVFFFSLHGIEPHLVIVPTLVLWILNILLPSLAGLYFLLRSRWFNYQPSGI